jgi:peptide/nickel transport system substrate-binding protein
VRYIALVTGDAHATVWPLLVEDSLSFENDPDFRLVRTTAGSVRFMPLNNERPQFSDVRVRRAMLMALDRQRIIDDLWDGAAVISHSNLSPRNGFYHNPNVRQYEFDPAAARALLDEAGWVEGNDGIRTRDGVRFSYTCTTITGDQARRPIAELSQVMLREVGIEMLLAEAPVASILEGLTNGTLESSLFNWTFGSTPEPDPSATLRTGGGNNFNRYSNPEMDALIDQGLRTVDPEERRPIYFQIQELFAEDVPCLYLHFDDWMNVFSNRIQGLPEEIISPDPVFVRGFEQSLG